ncbi:hypothetical protein [Leptospira koniambonensis]|nr:hypothetical protein [Leptospira koniambonensis]
MGWIFRINILSIFVFISFLIPSLWQLSADIVNDSRPLRVSWEDDAQERIEVSFNQKKNSNLISFRLGKNDISEIENSASLAILFAEEAFELNLLLEREREISLRPIGFFDTISLHNPNGPEKSSKGGIGDFETLNLLFFEWFSGEYFKDKSSDRLDQSIGYVYPDSLSSSDLKFYWQTNVNLRSIKKFRRYLAKLTHSDPDSDKKYLSFVSDLFDFSHLDLSFFFQSFSILQLPHLNKTCSIVGQSIGVSVISPLSQFSILILPLEQREHT